MISEVAIERVLDRLSGGGEDFAQDLSDFGEAQPFLLNYLTQEDTEAFTQPEQELLLFAAVVVYQSILEERSEPAQIQGEAIAKREEVYYQLLQDQAKGQFADRISIFFEQSQEEELLAFIEDLLSPDDDSPVSTEAREAMFVSLATVVGVLS